MLIHTISPDSSSSDNGIAVFTTSTINDIRFLIDWSVTMMSN